MGIKRSEIFLIQKFMQNFCNDEPPFRMATVCCSHHRLETIRALANCQMNENKKKIIVNGSNEHKAIGKLFYDSSMENFHGKCGNRSMVLPWEVFTAAIAMCRRYFHMLGMCARLVESLGVTVFAGMLWAALVCAWLGWAAMGCAALLRLWSLPSILAMVFAVNVRLP